jgi:hypothetical protein
MNNVGSTIGFPPRLRRRTLGTIGVVALAAIAVIAVITLTSRPRAGDPLQASSSYGLRVALATDEQLTWSTALPFNPTDSQVRIREVTLQAPSGLTILGVLMTYGVPQPDGSCLSAGGSYDFPPTAVRADGTKLQFASGAVRGAIVPAQRDRTCETHPSVSVGVRRETGTATGRIEGLRVVYEHGGAEYEVLLPYTLTVDSK